MIAVDTSVAVAAVAGWHEAHEASAAAIADGARLPAHCLVEAYSVLTRLPAPHRFAPAVARAVLRASFPGEPLALGSEAHAALLDRLSAAGVSGGAAYDGLVGLTAAGHAAVLLSRDRRAARVYLALGVPFELVG